jgi:hypothetical protein
VSLGKDVLQILTGCDFQPGDALKVAIAKRAASLIPTFVQRSGGYCYDGNRCRAENLGWRFIQNIACSRYTPAPGASIGPVELSGKNLPEPTPEAVERGEFDAVIEATFHDAASAEHYYRFEKRWD